MTRMKVSGSQIFWMITTMNYGMSALLTISPAIKQAKQDAWISMVIAGVIAVFITFVATKLSLLYPEQTIVEYSQTILGKWLGKMIIIPYLGMWFSVTSIILREFNDFTVMSMLSRTPMSGVIIPMALVVAFTAYGGIEGIGRLSEIMGPLIYLMLIILALLLYRDTNWELLLPIYVDTGWVSILKGSLPGASFLGESVMMVMLVPFMRQPEQAPSRAMWGVVITSLALVLWILMPLTVFGPSVATKMWFPVYDAARIISVMEFVQNIETFGIILWFFSVFIKLAMYMFITSYATAQWIGIKNWRYALGFVVIIVIIGAMLPRNMDIAAVNYPQFWLKYIFPINMIAIPLLLWIVGLVQRRKINPES